MFSDVHTIVSPCLVSYPLRSIGNECDAEASKEVHDGNETGDGDLEWESDGGEWDGFGGFGDFLGCWTDLESSLR
jgi:hypothetical protein